MGIDTNKFRYQYRYYIKDNRYYFQYKKKRRPFRLNYTDIAYVGGELYNCLFGFDNIEEMKRFIIKLEESYKPVNYKKIDFNF